MTVTRIGQLTGELRYPAEFIEFLVSASFSDPPPYSNTDAKTGSWSYRWGLDADLPIGVAMSPQTYIRAGMWMRHNGTIITNAVPRIFTWHVSSSSATTSRVSFDNSNDLLKLFVLGTEQDSISVATVGFNNLNVWRHAGLVVKADTTNGFASFYLDGERILHYEGNTGVDIGAVYAMGHVTVNHNWNSFAYMDDYYLDALTDEEDAAPPAKRFMWSPVSGGGADEEFTPVSNTNAENVQDSPPDDDASYNKALIPGLKDTFNTENITVPDDHVIRAVIPIAIARKMDAGLDIRLKIHSYDGGNYQSSDAKTLTSFYQVVLDRQPLQPDGSNWNEIDFNAMQFGYESSGTFT